MNFKWKNKKLSYNNGNQIFEIFNKISRIEIVLEVVCI